MNNKGFAITGVLYSVLVLFIVLVALLLFSLQNKKTILDRMKEDTIESIERNVQKNANYDVDASEVEISINGLDANNVAEALDYLYERSS